jgi:transketolase
MTAPTASRPGASIDELAINTIRTLSIDAIQKANSGHPGTVMAMAPVAYELWQRFLRFDPEDPVWPNRDRFVLSAGHASMLLYSLLHLAGVKAVNPDYEALGELSVKLSDIEHFRQLDSRAPGHPEYRWTSGVETTTGPLGQGVATSVGMAIASQWLGATYNRPGFELFDFDVYALAGDGDMMEGVSYEAASLAGHLRLANLCWIYDNNRITIDGSTDLTFSDDVAGRFMAQGWNVTRVGDANDLDLVGRAFEAFKTTVDRPTLIVVDSHIGYGAPEVQDTAAAHGEPLGEEVARAAKRFYGWPEDAQFLVPDGVRERFGECVGRRGREAREDWERLFDRYGSEHPELASQIECMQRRELPESWDDELPSFEPDAKGIATRAASGQTLNAIAVSVPWVVGGAADLTGSTSVGLKFPGADSFSPEHRGGRYLHFGVREHGMGATVNGLSLSKLRPYGSTYLIFSDYMREPLRLSALMEVPAIWIFTHDSIGVGEDGPTHQPVEQLASLRAMPGLVTIRPCDANEAVEAWRVIMRMRHSPVALVLTRQAVPILDRERYAPASGLARGAYVLADPEDGDPELILIGTGSEVQLCVEACEQLTAEGEKVRVVSMPSWELFDLQPEEYRAEVLPPEVQARVSVEQASSLGWERFVGTQGATIGMHTFGASAPLKDVQKKFGFTPDAIVAACRHQLATRRGVEAR